MKESLALRTEIGDKHGVIECLEGLAKIALAQSQWERAARLMSVSQGQRQALNIRLSDPEQTRFDCNKAAARSALEEEVFTTAWARGQESTLEQAIAYAQSTHTQ